MNLRFEPHSHTCMSNFRLLDCINKPEDLIQRAIDLNLQGIAVTDHETIAAAPQVMKYYDEIKEEYPDFKIGLGNEIYLIENSENIDKYYHYILIAKNRKGFDALKELSSIAWSQSYTAKGMERVPTYYHQLEKIVKKYPDSLIATTACLGGFLPSTTLCLIEAEQIGDNETIQEMHNRIVNFMLWNKKLFNDDFYIEIAPGQSKEQVIVNQRLINISQAFNVKIVIGTDAHYLKKEDSYVHEAYLNSKSGEREVRSFYEYAYLQSEEEIITNLKVSNFSTEQIYKFFENSMEIYDKIEMYSIWHNQTIPTVEVKNYPKRTIDKKYPTLAEMGESDDIYNRYWINQTLDKLKEKDLYNETYLNRLEEEAQTKKVISEKLGTNIFKYPIVLQHYIDLIWDCGSMVGAGRGSSCAGLNHYLLGVTQLNPIKWDLPWFRYLNESRVELPDIDIDVCPSKKDMIINKIKEERSHGIDESFPDEIRNNLGCVLVGTYGTETARSAINTSCRGYRSEEFPQGIDSDISAYLASLVPVERGFSWTLKEMYYGDKEKGKKPIAAFKREVDMYPGLLDIMFGIEGLVKQRSSHASGIIMNDSNPFEFLAYMKAPNGNIITQFDLHSCEAMGATKYDMLVTDVQDKLVTTIELLQKDNKIEKELSLREIYDKYFHPENIDLEDEDIWNNIKRNKILNCFQFDSDVGRQAIAKIQPSNIQELADSNGLMRLMAAEKGGELPLDKYVRYKNNIDLWYQEMKKYNITDEEVKVLEKYFLVSYGVPPSQEQLMRMLMDKDLCNFSIEEANKARKIVAKKNIKDVPLLHKQVLEKAKNKNLGEYIWKFGLGPQMSYSFSIIHALAYSMIGYQTALIATKWNPIYWDTGCLIVNSGGLDDKTTDYTKIAKALGNIIEEGINVSLVDINKSDYTFSVDEENNKILYGFNPLSGINQETIEVIMKNRPYKGIKDFINRVTLKKPQMISLIKSGAFDFDESLDCNRMKVMAYYITQIAGLKTNLTLANIPTLNKYNFIPQEHIFERQFFFLTRELRKNYKYDDYYILTPEFIDFLQSNCEELLEYVQTTSSNLTVISQKVWKKYYEKIMDRLREWISIDKSKILKQLNLKLAQEVWKKYAEGTISYWEMQSMCFYYHEHELANVNKDKYGIEEFNKLPKKPNPVKYFRKTPLFEITKIMGTVINKNDAKSSISLLVPEGYVVSVKFTREFYAMFNRQISAPRMNGTKEIKEKSWFTRGTKLVISGFRRDDMFVCKKYSSTPWHQLYKITEVEENDILLTDKRYGQE